MRAVCEQCQTVQPADWQVGDLCVQCGQTVRRERRCHWCARLTPDGKFCRHCGSGLVADALYGPARMLKAGGVDQFSLPERLALMPADQLEHFSRLYAPHERAVERHVDDLAFVERFLRGGSGWSAALEDTLLPQLPLAADALRALSLAPARAVGDLERLAEIRDGSPFASSAQLAALARVRSAAPRNSPDADAASAALGAGDARLREEAALALGNWRYIVNAPYGAQVRDLEQGLLEVYNASGSLEAALALTLLKRQYANVWGANIDPATLEPLLGSEDLDQAFGAAIALEDQPRLLAALRVPERRYAAAITLARGGVADALVQILPLLESYEQHRVLDTLRYTVGAVPALHDTLVSIVEGTTDHALKRTAAALLAIENRPEDALRLIRADDSLISAVLRNPALEPISLERVLVRLLETGRFNLYGLSALGEIADGGRVSDGFVPDAFAAADEFGWQELCSFARLQLIARGDQTLHRFLWTVLEGELPERARERAWAALNGWYSHNNAPLRMSLPAARTYFGGVQPLLERLCATLEQPETLNRLHAQDELLAMLLQHMDDDILPAILELSAPLERLRHALWTLARDPQTYTRNRVAGVQLLARLAQSRATRETFEDELRDLFLTDPPWDVRRAALEALDVGETTRLRTELETLLGTALTSEHRELAKTLLDDLEYVLSQRDG